MKEEATTQQPSYSIGVVARITGLSVHTLRMWERRYGLGASKRSKAGQREFTKTDLEHLKLIKQLLEQGMRIGDIAKLPKKTLSSLCIGNENLKPLEEHAEPVETIVVGHMIQRFFTEHSMRYPGLKLNFYPQSPEEWLKRQKPIERARLVVFQIDMINRAWLNLLKKYKENGLHIIVIYQYANSDILYSLEHSGVKTARGAIEVTMIDTLIQQSLKLLQHTSLLKQNSEQFGIDLPQSHPRQFSSIELANAASLSGKIACECPKHLSDIINSLNALEEYSQDCGADNWQEAAIHACIYAYTSQARHLMEQALSAVLSADEYKDVELLSKQLIQS